MISPRLPYTVPLPGRLPLRLGPRTLVMGILNVTPDSFTDGGLNFDQSRAVERGRQMVAEGADILDVGGESTRPGAEPVSAEEELRRVLPVIRRLAAIVDVPISIDTYKAVVAREAVALGATIVNDISALQFDPGLAAVAAETGAALVLMHNRGTSRDIYREAVYDDVVAEVIAELEASMARAEAAGVDRRSLILDPGFGFAKRRQHSYRLLAGLDRLAVLERPILSGPSRKSFLRTPASQGVSPDHDWATAGAVTASILSGAHVIRVHNVAGMVEVARVADELSSSAASGARPL